jgi:predicted SnoaL-like aldol condensation-catalyzing enzyme
VTNARSGRTQHRLGVLAALSLACAVSVAPVMADDTGRSPAEQRNLAFVLDFWNNVFMKRDATRFAEFFGPDYVDHNPNITTPGLPGLLEYVHKLSARAPAAPQPGAAPRPSGPPASDVVVAMVDGELVTLIRKRMLPDPQDPSKTYEAFGFETLRVHDGKIVEHWDSVVRQGAPATGAPAAVPTNSR